MKFADALSVVNAPVSVGATTPAVPTGSLIYSTTTSSLLLFNGSSWQSSGVTAVTASGNLASSGGNTPAISMTATPTFTSVTATGMIVAGTGFTGSVSGDISCGRAGGTTGSIYMDSSGNRSIYFGSPNTFFFNGGGIQAGGPIWASFGSRSAVTGQVQITNDGTTNAYIIGGLTGAGAGYYFQNASFAYLPLFASAFTTSSDGRSKTDIVDSPYSLNALLSLKARKFTRITTGEPELGFIAQEVMMVLPELVKADADGFYTMNYNGVIPVLVAAVQQLSAQLTAYVAAHP